MESKFQGGLGSSEDGSAVLKIFMARFVPKE